LFSITGPLVASESDGGACSTDSMKTIVIKLNALNVIFMVLFDEKIFFQTTNGLTVPTICGLNTGQHRE